MLLLDHPLSSRVIDGGGGGINPACLAFRQGWRQGIMSDNGVGKTEVDEEVVYLADMPGFPRP